MRVWVLRALVTEPTPVGEAVWVFDSWSALRRNKLGLVIVEQEPKEDSIAWEQAAPGFRVKYRLDRAEVLR